MSPEVVSGNFALAASGLWSFGVMLFMMVSGGLSPFWAGNDYKTEARVLGEITAFYLHSEEVKMSHFQLETTSLICPISTQSAAKSST